MFWPSDLGALTSAHHILFAASHQPASRLATQKRENVRFTADKPLETDMVKAAIAKAEAALSGQGRLLMRPSNTEKLIRVIAEGDDEALVKRMGADVAGAVRSA